MMKSRPFLLKHPNLDNARAKLKAKSDDWKTAYPITILGPVVVPWGWMLPRWMLPSASKGSRESGKELARSTMGEPPTPPKAPQAKLARSNLSSLTINESRNDKCMLLRKLPLELRLEVFSHVLGKDAFRIISVPWRVIAVPDVEGNISMAAKYDFINDYDMTQLGSYMQADSTVNAPEAFIRSSGTAILRTCRQIYAEAVDLLYTTNTFILYDFHTLTTFAKSIPPQRLNAIRSLRVHYSPTTSIPYPHERTPQYDLPLNLDWFWEIVIGMQSLRDLDVYMEAYDFSRSPWEIQVIELSRLGPMEGIRGLSKFQLQLGYIQQDSSIRFKPYAPAFRGELMEIVRRPRGS